MIKKIAFRGIEKEENTDNCNDFNAWIHFIISSCQHPVDLFINRID